MAHRMIARLAALGVGARLAALGAGARLAALGAGARLAALGAIALFAAGFAAAPARAESPAEAQAFMEKTIADGVAVMADRSIPADSRKTKIRTLLGRIMDTKRIGLYSLGAAKQSASQADLDAYLAAFHDFMLASYVNRVGDYNGQAIKVTGVMTKQPGDYIVLAQFAGSTGAGPVPVNVRVLAESGTYGVVDASVAGVWFMQAQAADFTGFLGQHNNSVPLLTEHLKALTAAGFKVQ